MAMWIFSPWSSWTAKHSRNVSAAMPLTEREARSIALQLCAGLAEAHRKQVIHGDLKSNNIILTTDGNALRAVITDFGLACRPDSATRALQSKPDGRHAGLHGARALEGRQAVECFRYLCAGSYSSGALAGPALVTSDCDAALIPILHAGSIPQTNSCRTRSLRGPGAGSWLPLLRRCWLSISGVGSYRTATAPKETVRLAMLPFDSAPEDLVSQYRGSIESGKRQFANQACAYAVE